jgi:hypothetical protein
MYEDKDMACVCTVSHLQLALVLSKFYEEVFLRPLQDALQNPANGSILGLDGQGIVYLVGKQPFSLRVGVMNYAILTKYEAIDQP